MDVVTYRAWLARHLAEATAHYEATTELAEASADEDTELYEKSHQMFGYVAALEKCLRELDQLTTTRIEGGLQS